MCQRSAWAVAALLASAVVVAQDAGNDRFRIDPDAYLAHVRFLASDDLGGRGNGTAGVGRAAAYIAGELKKAGLEPGGDRNTYLQAFDLTGRDDTASVLTVRSATGEVPFQVGTNFYPLSASDNQEPSGGRARALPIVFAGYGISAPGLGYDDFAHVDVEGKAVVVFTHEPQENRAGSVFAGLALTPFGAIGHKADEAGRRGARLLIVVEDPVHLTDRALATAWLDDPQIGDYRIPVVRMDRLRLSRALGGIDFPAIARTIDDTLVDRSQTIAGASITLPKGLVAFSPSGSNVVGVLRGTHPVLAAETIVVGAHYDHLGTHGHSARDEQAGAQIFNGADDNASGTALVIEIARAAARQRTGLRRTVVFAAFAGEEVGLLGSRSFVQRAADHMRRTIAMVNLDMVGRAHGRVMVGGALEPLLSARTDALRSPLRIEDFQNGYGEGSSDNDSFERARVPTLLFFTGFHDDYHQPSDDWPLIDAPGAAEIGRMALEIVATLATR